MKKEQSEGVLLGDFPFELKKFEGLDSVFSSFRSKEFQEKNQTEARTSGLF